MPGAPVISNALEDYLETILNLSEQKSAVRTTDLAVHMQVAKPTVTETVKSLVNHGLLRHEKYGPLELTEKGRQKALKIRYRHTILKKFLTDILGVKPETANREACLMEHAISPDTADKLAQFLENICNNAIEKKY
ncbi:MAG: metal-dependent transcriptional regulator [Peptococcaceae bacterium]|jgi:DtxR family Mn-dependent transcriptional regulator|nr:metal-dependent transcriptional regulator [Peptococcaceae bacterium]MDH7524551.1 metal-dependent transcriptional regulator [Peptococcaceae bacterium]